MRTRDIKPGFYLNDQLAECSFAARLAFPGLWMVADREGRLEYRPKRLKAEIFPYDDVDMVALIDELLTNCLVVRYQVDGKEYLWIPTFLEHQKPHPNEKESVIPPYSDGISPANNAGTAKDDIPDCLGATQDNPRCEAGTTKGITNPASYLSFNISESNILSASAPDAAHSPSPPCPSSGQPQGQPEEPPAAPARPPEARARPDGESYRAKSGKILRGEVLASFEAFMAAFDYRKGKAEAADAWLKIRPQGELLAHILDAARQEAAKRPMLEQKGHTPKWPQGWLTARRWEDYEPARASPAKAPARVEEQPLDEEAWQKAQEARKALEAARKPFRQMGGASCAAM